MSVRSVSSDDTISEPEVPPDSPGSSVSSRFQEEYDELLKYAVILPNYVVQPQQTLTDTIDEGMRGLESEEEGGTIVEEEEGLVTDTEPAENYSKSVQSTPKSVTIDTYPKVHLGSTMDSSIAHELFPHNEQVESCPVVSEIIDDDVRHMEAVLDKSTLDLKRNIMAEFGQRKIRILEQHRQTLLKEQERRAAENSQLQNEVESLKELLHTYEQSIERKDQVISNLTQGLQKQKEKMEKFRAFSDWKTQLVDQKREAFTSALAKQYHERQLMLKCWVAWHSVIENKWKQRVEKACQAKAEEVCLKLTDDYEAKIKSLNEALESSRSEVSRLHTERETYEETMKKAFMRGVCALNMEAMNMFHDSMDSTGSKSHATSVPDTDSLSVPLDSVPSMPVTIPQEAVYTNEPPGAPLPRVITSQSATKGTAPGQGIITQSKVSKTKGKTITAKVSARVDTGRKRDPIGPTPLAPPMTSVVVERHHAVTKQTIGHATASKYPAKPSQPSVVQHKASGQIAGQVPIATPNVQTVKVVD